MFCIAAKGANVLTEKIVVVCRIAVRNSLNPSKRVLKVFHHCTHGLERIYLLFYTAGTLLFCGILVAFITFAWLV